MIESTVTTVTYLFSDIEGSTRLWESDPVHAARTVAWHDEVSRAAVQRYGGRVVKTTGDGVHAAFGDAVDAVAAVIELQLGLAEPGEGCVPIKVRCGLHLGADQRRDNDFYGQAVNRAARIMSAAHGGQVLVSGAVAERVSGRLPREVVLRDLGTVRLRDLGLPEHVFQVIHPALRKEFPPLRSMATTPNNLAQQLNSFVGRDREMEQVRQLLANSRLLTLLGMGGLGKSRLSVQVAAVVLDNYPDGVWFVELAALSDPQLVPQAVASVLGVKEEPGGTVTDALVRFVRDRQLLIVLDNCEHVVQACAVLAKRLLEAGPKVQLLASSRDSLRIAGETTFPISPLSAPEKGGVTSIGTLMAIDSVRLFVDRASAVQPAFRLDEAAVGAVAEICRRLDGIPLAIELAAARVRAMSVQQIASRLGDRFRLLSRGDRTASPRQQTLRALIDWSHDLLDPPERALFRRLAVFSGGWTLDAAEAVVIGGEIDANDVLELMSNLVEKSLVVLETGGNRYGMLDTVRDYARECLAAAGEAVAVASAHARFFLMISEQAHQRLFAEQQSTTLSLLDTELENLLAAHGFFSRAQSSIEDELRFCGALGAYWLKRGFLDTGCRVTEGALERAGAQLSGVIGLRSLYCAGQLHCAAGRYVEGSARLHRALDIARGLGDPGRLTLVLQKLGMAYTSQGDFASASLYAQEAVDVARSARDEHSTAVALNELGQLYRAQGAVARAEPLYREALALMRRSGDEDSVAVALLNLAMASLELERHAEARMMLHEAVGIASRLGPSTVGTSAIEVAAVMCLLEQDPATASRLFDAARAYAQFTGMRREKADEAFLAPFIDRLEEKASAISGANRRPANAINQYAEAIALAASWLTRGSGTGEIQNNPA
jgi:predicted ATPase/class 3 adenylate cyclase